MKWNRGYLTTFKLGKSILSTVKNQISNILHYQLYSFISILFFIIYLSQIILSRFFEINVFDSYLWLLADGWCPPPNETSFLKSHCFGDYGTTIYHFNQANPWDEFSGLPVNPYPAAGYVTHVLFNQIGLITNNSNLGLLSYVLTLLLFSLFPIIYILKSKISNKVVKIIILSPLMGTLLFAIDRGNAVVFTIPFIFLALKSYLENHLKQLLIYLIILSILKPVFIILTLLFLLQRSYLKFLIASVTVFFVQLYAFLQYTGENTLAFILSRYIASLEYYSNYQSLETIYPYNISFVRGIVAIHNFVSSILQIDNSLLLSFILNNKSIISVIPLFLFLVLFFIFGSKLVITKLGIFTFLITISISLSPITYQYYLIVYIPILAHIFLSENSKGIFYQKGFLETSLAITTALLITFSVTPVIFLKVYLNDINNFLTTIFFVPILIVIYFTIFLLYTFQITYQNTDRLRE